MSAVSYQDVLDFWFKESTPQQWFKKDPNFDRQITERFTETWARASRCELFAWREHSMGRLAEILVLDQFSRNIFRDRPESFSQDSLALALAQEAVRTEDLSKIAIPARGFFYMPYMHSESVAIHQEALTLFRQPGLESNYDFEVRHLEILRKFGRYPHRNAILGRTSTAEEIEFLNQPGSSF